MSPRLTRSRSRTLYCLSPSEVRRMHGLVAVGEIGQAADGDHHVEQRHLLLVGQRLRLGRLADDADLLAVRADEAGRRSR